MEQPASHKIILAPFRGITMKPFRNAMARFFPWMDEMVAPFFSGIGSEKVHPTILSDLVPKKENLTHTVPQILSAKSGEIILAAEALEKEGYHHLNWNLGCPFSRIAHKKKGCGMLPFPELLSSILHRVFSQIQIGLSIKTRLGNHDPNEIHAVLKAIEPYPIHSIVLHPRTGDQGYRGTANPHAYKDCLTRTHHRLIYNGDIYNLNQFQHLQALLPDQKEWMIGRGVLINPFLPAEIKGIAISSVEKTEKLLGFHQELWEHAKDHISKTDKRLGAMKSVWHYLSGIKSGGPELFNQIKKTRTEKAYLEAVAEMMALDFSNQYEQKAHFLSLTTKRSSGQK